MTVSIDPTYAELIRIWLPIFVSFLAFIVSFLTLCWTVYRDVVRKPKFKVSVSVDRLIGPGLPPYIGLHGVNLGPEKLKSGTMYLRNSWLRRKVLERSVALAYVQPDFRHPSCSQANQWVDAGDTVIYVFPYDERAEMLREKFVQIGIGDGFGRIHWAPKSQFAKLKTKYARDFGNRREE